MNPDFVKPGEPLKASWGNDVVSSLRNSTFNATAKSSQSKRIYKPFDPVSLELEGSTWYLKIQEAFYFENGKNTPTEIEISSDTLGEYPKITIQANKDLYFNWSTKKLVWANSDIIGNLKILSFVYDGADFQIKNLHPCHIDLRQAPPFTPLLSNTDGAFTVAVTRGYLCERIPSQTGGALNVRFPDGVESGGELVHHAITNEQQLSVIVQVDKTGAIYASGGNAVQLAVEASETDSTHYTPAGGDDDEGQGGVYHYKLCNYAGGIQNFLGGSNIDHFRDLPVLSNTIDPDEPETGTGRVFQKYDKGNSIYLFRVIKEKEFEDEDEESQIKIVENADDIQISGNDKNGSLMIEVNGTAMDSRPLEWKDGLITNDEDLEWTLVFPKSDEDGDLKYKIGAGDEQDLFEWEKGLIMTGGNFVVPIPELYAGDRIEITESNNIFTISSTAETGQTGSLSYNNGSEESDTTLIEWEEGLVMTEGDIVIPIPSVVGSGDISVSFAGNVYTVSASLSSAGGIPDPPSMGTYVLMAVDGNVQWGETHACLEEEE